MVRGEREKENPHTTREKPLQLVKFRYTGDGELGRGYTFAANTNNGTPHRRETVMEKRTTFIGKTDLMAGNTFDFVPRNESIYVASESNWQKRFRQLQFALRTRKESALFERKKKRFPTYNDRM